MTKVRRFVDPPPPQLGDRLFVQCVGGGPCTSRLVYYPVPLEIQERGGVYVLNDDGEPHEWSYIWAPR